MLTREFVENLAVTSSLDTAKRERERTGGASANQRPERPKVPRLDAETDSKREMSGCEQRRMKKRRVETETLVTERIQEVLETRGDGDGATSAPLQALDRAGARSALDHWLGERLRLSKIEEDFTDEEYGELIKAASDTTRRNWGCSGEDASMRRAADDLQAAFSQKVGANVALPTPRGTFDPVVPDIGELQRQGLLADSRYYLQSKYKRSTDGNVQTVRRHWFRFCFTAARISPIRPQSGTSHDAATVEESIWISFAAFLAKRVTGKTVAGYISLLKRWHKAMAGWDPISSAITDKVMLKQALAGIRAELPSKKRRRFAHPTRLFRQWWAPLERRSGSEPAIMDLDCPDLSKLSWQHRIEIALTLRRRVIATGMSLQDLKYIALSTAMTAGLLRVSEAIPKHGTEQPPPMQSDCAFKFDAEGLLTHVNLWIKPLKKGKGVEKLPVKIKHSRGHIRASFFLWLMTAIDPVKPELASSTPLFRDYGWEGSSVLVQDKFRAWYQQRISEGGCEFAHCYNTHSFRIAGATALLAARVPIEFIKAMGRWASDIAEIYTRPTEESLLELSRAMDVVDATGLEVADDEYLDRLAGVCEDDADAWAEALVAEAPEEDPPVGTGELE